MIEKLNFLSALFKSITPNIVMDINRFCINDFTNEIEDELSKNGFEFDKETNRIVLKIKKATTQNLVPFNDLKLFELEYLHSNFLILNTNGDYCFFEGEIIYNENPDEGFKTTCENLIAYYKLFECFISEDFCDHYNPAKREIVLYSSINGIFKIKYDSIPKSESVTSHTSAISELIVYLQSIELQQYFKNSFFTYSKGTGAIMIDDIIRNIGDVISTSKRDYELVAKQFNFEKFKDSLYKEKEKYFSEIREVVNKIFSQAIAIPVSITATAFATYKIGDDNLILFLVLFAFLLYSAFYIKIQLIYRADVKEIKTNFERDFTTIKDKSGLPNDTIEIEETKIKRRIETSLSIIKWLIVTVIILAILLVIYIYCQMYKVEKMSLINSMFYFKNLISKA